MACRQQRAEQNLITISLSWCRAWCFWQVSIQDLFKIRFKTMQSDQPEKQGGKYNFLPNCYLKTLSGSWLHSYHKTLLGSWLHSYHILYKFFLLFLFSRSWNMSNGSVLHLDFFKKIKSNYPHKIANTPGTLMIDFNFLHPEFWHCCCYRDYADSSFWQHMNR